MAKKETALDFNELSEEAQEVAKAMIEHCLNCGYRLGMDEGMDENDKPLPFRLELEIFSGYKR